MQKTQVHFQAPAWQLTTACSSSLSWGIWCPLLTTTGCCMPVPYALCLSHKIHISFKNQNVNHFPRMATPRHMSPLNWSTSSSSTDSWASSTAINLLTYFSTYLPFWDRVSLCRPGCPWNLQRSVCLCLPNAGIKDVCHYTQLSIAMFVADVVLEKRST